MRTIPDRLLSLCIALLLMLSACAPASSPSAVRETESGAASAETAVPQLPAGTLRFVTDDDLFTGRYVGNSDGYYYVDRGGDIAANLRYIDYASAQDVFLSSRPEGDRFSPEDDSFLSSVAGYGTVFPDGGTLYLVRTGAPGYTEKYGQDALAAVFVMAPDGSGRRMLYTGGAEEKLLSTIAADDENLYLIQDEVTAKSGVPEEKRRPIRISRETGEKSTLCDLTGSSWMIGAVGDALVFHSIHEDGTGESGAPAMVHEILTYRFDSQKLSVVQSWAADRTAFAKVCGDKLVTADVTEKTVAVQDLASGELLNTFSMEQRAPADGTSLWFLDCIDGKFVFWNYLQEQLWGMDTETGEWTAVTLTYQDPEKKETRPVEVYAETETEFLVCRDKEYVVRRLGTTGGGSEEQEVLQPVLALISKEDYWNSVPDFRDIEWND